MADEFVLRNAEEREEGAWVPIPDQSLLSAKVLSVSKATMPFKDKDTGAEVVRTKWVFAVTDPGPFDGRKVEGLSGIEFVKHSNCKLYQWTKAVLGSADLPEGFKLSTDDLSDLTCEILVDMKEKERRDGKGLWVNNSVVDVRPSENRPVAVGSAYGSANDEEPF